MSQSRTSGYLMDVRRRKQPEQYGDKTIEVHERPAQSSHQQQAQRNHRNIRRMANRSKLKHSHTQLKNIIQDAGIQPKRVGSETKVKVYPRACLVYRGSNNGIYTIEMASSREMIASRRPGASCTPEERHDYKHY